MDVEFTYAMNAADLSTLVGCVTAIILGNSERTE